MGTGRSDIEAVIAVATGRISADDYLVELPLGAEVPVLHTRRGITDAGDVGRVGEQDRVSAPEGGASIG